MQFADIENPFINFLYSCNKSDLLEHVPTHARKSLYGMCPYLTDHWKPLNELYKGINTIYIISLDGIGSKELYEIWEQHRYTCTPLIPDYMQNNDSVIVFDNSAEGHCDNYIFKFISQVVGHYKLDTTKTYYCNSSANVTDLQSNTPYTNFITFTADNYLEDAMTNLQEDMQTLLDTVLFREEDEVFDIEMNLSKQFLFSCLNNAPKPYRALLLGAIAESGLDGFCSSPRVPYDQLYGASVTYLSAELSNNNITKADFKTGLQWLDLLEPHYPLILDSPSENSIHMKELSADKTFISNLFDCDISVVTESMVDNNLFVSEKIYKPIIMCQPFIVLGPSRVYKYISNLGYNTFDYILDNKKMDISNNIINRIKLIIDALNTLKNTKADPIAWKTLNDKIAIDVVHNYNTFNKRLHGLHTAGLTSLDGYFKYRPGLKQPLYS
tara:strand:- start:16053 stop:17372 length:1320 start_codon:yes stop_codon:yes gene_type:complete